jgi:hypothetical protein
MTTQQTRPAAAPASHRLGAQPGEVIDRSRTLGFTWNGRPATAHPGDSIASALAAAGERVLSRSFKYHRPRGILTASYHDPGCIPAQHLPAIRFRLGIGADLGVRRIDRNGLDLNQQVAACRRRARQVYIHQ